MEVDERRFWAAYERFAVWAQGRRRLSPTQTVHLWLLCCGVHRLADTTRLLGVARATVGRHRTAVYRALGVPCEAGAVAAAWPSFVAAWRGVGVDLAVHATPGQPAHAAD